MTIRVNDLSEIIILKMQFGVDKIRMIEKSLKFNPNLSVALLLRIRYYIDQRDLPNSLLSLNAMEVITPNSVNIALMKDHINRIFINDDNKKST